MSRQIPLQFEFRGDQTFDNFFSEPHRETLAHLQALLNGNGERQILLYGGSGIGKTHLLLASCHWLQQRQQSGFYLDMRGGSRADPEVLDGLENYPLLCLDNVDAAAGDARWEHALFHLYNRCQANACRLLCSASVAPAHLSISLPDLRTRLAWGLVLPLRELQEDEKIALLAYRAKRLGFDLPAAAARYILQHHARDLPSLWTLLDQLDQETLAAKRKLSIPFIKEILSRNG